MKTIQDLKIELNKEIQRNIENYSSWNGNRIKKYAIIQLENTKEYILRKINQAEYKMSGIKDKVEDVD